MCQTFVQIDGEYMRITGIKKIVIRRYSNPEFLYQDSKIKVLWNRENGRGQGVDVSRI